MDPRARCLASAGPADLCRSIFEEVFSSDHGGRDAGMVRPGRLSAVDLLRMSYMRSNA